jgi:thiamine-monophosphate kinase
MQEKRTDISSLGEFGLIDHLTRHTEQYHAGTLVGIGDDAAVIDTFGKNMVITTDMLVEGIHFDLMYMPLKHLGYKAVTVNLSDVYAMNATPTQITVSIAISNRFSVEALDELYEGINLACERYHVDLVGGDTTTSQKGLILSITALGEVEDGTHVTRSGAKENDLIVVTGNLGAAYMGLLLLEREKKVFLESPGVKPDLEDQTYILERFMKPEAQRKFRNTHENLLNRTRIKWTEWISTGILLFKRSNRSSSAS